MTTKQRMYDQIKAHGEDLTRIFFNVTDDPIKLCKRVHRLEAKAHQLAEDYCNGKIDSEAFENQSQAVLDSLNKVIYFRERNIPVFINGDARGYALKIEDDYVREHNLKIHRDWGGYGIIAPEFDGKN